MQTRPHSAEYITSVNAKYHDAIADKYNERLEGYHPSVLAQYRKRFERDILPHLKGPATVLDMGCGGGYLEQFLAGKGLKIMGIDVAEKQLAVARGLFPDVDYRAGDVYQFPLQDKFDLVMENGVLHHLYDWEAVVDRMAALTGPGGVLYLGNEPSSYAYRGLAPFKKLFRMTVNRGRTQDAADRLGDGEFEALAEYQLFFGTGFNPRRLRKRLLAQGFKSVKLYFSLRELLAALEEHWRWMKLNRWLPGVLVENFPLSRNFDLVAYK